MHYLIKNILNTGIITVCCTWFSASHAATVTLLTQVNSNQANNASYTPSISGDGRYVVFASDADNLVADDTNQVSDIFLIDTQDGTITRVSVDTTGGNANDASQYPVISADGRYIAFESFASNLVPADTNLASDIFLYDTLNATTRRISVDSSGIQANSHSFGATLSGNGEIIAFYSMARNLVAGDTNRSIDVFVHNTTDNSTRRVSVSSTGVQANMDSWQAAVNATGQFVVFSSNATNLDSLDTNGAQDIYLHDLASGETTLVSLTSDNQISNGLSAFATISADGSIIAFESTATNLVIDDNNGYNDIFAVNRTLNTVTRVSVSASGTDANGPAYGAAVSQDGRFVSYYSYASNIVVNDPNGVEDVFVYDLRNNATELLTLNNSAQVANGSSFNASLSNDGRYIVASSSASNLIEPDSNNADDIFLFDRGVINDPPIANAGSDVSLVLGSMVTLDGSASFDPDGNPLVSQTWRVVSAPSGSLLGSWTSDRLSVEFIPDVAGVFVLALTVNDGLANSNPDELFVNVSNNLPPSASITASPLQGYAPLQVSFDGSNSSDPESGSLELRWDFGNGNTSTEISPVFSFINPGTYPVTLTVTDLLGNQDQAMVVITVLPQNQPPQIQSLSITPVTGSAPLLVDFVLRISDPDNDHLTVAWDLGDNQRIENSLAFSHLYTDIGTYAGTVTVSDGYSDTVQEFVITVGSGFQLGETKMSVYVNHQKPEYGKINLTSHFDLATQLQADDPVTMKLGKLEIINLTLGDFMKVKPDVYIYKKFGLFVKLDLYNQSITVTRKQFVASEQDLESAPVLTLQLGTQQASIAPDLFKSDVCRHREKRYGMDQDSDCQLTVYKTRRAYKH